MKNFIKYSILVLSASIMNVDAATKTDWVFSEEKIDGVNTFSIYGFDKSIENTLNISCDSSNKLPIVTIITDQRLTKKEKSVVSFKFDDELKIKSKAYYTDGTVWFSNMEEDNKGVLSIANLIGKLKKRSKVTIGVVRDTGKSFYFDISLSGSSIPINRILSKCNIK